MTRDTFKRKCIFDTLDGLRDGLSHFSNARRVALIYALEHDSPVRVYDPQRLLRGHEPRLKELYLDSDDWRKDFPAIPSLQSAGHIYPRKNLHLTGLISYGGSSGPIFYQMWFTEQPPDICAAGPFERWLEQAAWRMSHDFANENDQYTGISGFFLREYAVHAVRDHIIDELNLALGMDIHLRIYPVLDAVLGISETREEKERAYGKILFIEPRMARALSFLARFPENDCPQIHNFRHVRKLLQAVEHSRRKLISDGERLIGIAGIVTPPHAITAEFKGDHGFLRLGKSPICSFADGKFQASNRRANLVQLEEILIDAHIDPPDNKDILFKMITAIVHHACDSKHGCSIVVDFGQPPIAVSGQHLETPLDLEKPHLLELAKSLSKLDGALHIGADLKLYGFACILDGHAIANENRARGARFNSALRFSAEHSHLALVVVSTDRPVSVIKNGRDLSARLAPHELSSCVIDIPLLSQWVQGNHDH
jgi:hypothetical protein